MSRIALIALPLMCLILACSTASESTEPSHEEPLVRSLDEGWQFRQADQQQWLPAVVPGNVHMDLLANEKIEDPFYKTNEKDQLWIETKDWVYRTNFVASEAEQKATSCILKFHGLDTYADVWLNDSLILQAFNMFRTWEVDVAGLLQANNELKIVFASPINKVMDQYEARGFTYPANNDQAEKKVSIFTRKAGYHYGWDWGPRFVTSGIWRDIELITWNKASMTKPHIVQTVLNDTAAVLDWSAEIDSKVEGAGELYITVDGKHATTTPVVLSNGVVKASADIQIDQPEQWWPAQLGSQKLYNIQAELKHDGQVIASSTEQIGLRTVELVNEFDSLGKSFYFKINGRPVFMKGANYIPSDNFQSRIDSAKYRALIQSALDANMNMIRVWGGGIYEEEYFYDLCDQNGLLVWQDFMFGCSMYPGDSVFVDNVRNEAIDNVKRLRNRPSVVLWCGNNEMETAWHDWGWQKKNGYSVEQEALIWNDYKKVFHQVLPAVVAEFDPTRAYHRSSPSATSDTIKPQTIGYGDMHYWGVWHAEEPYEAYADNVSRFMSEYGFQSFPNLETVKTYATEEDFDIESAVMLHHQRHPRGNQLIREYMSRDYHIPQKFDDFLYVGQVLQGEIIKFAAQTHRQHMPYCMGTLYWQLNDCWPVASWAGMDYYLNWKAQHYYIRDVFKDLMVGVKAEGNDLGIYVVNDRPRDHQGVLRYVLLNFEGDTLKSGAEQIQILDNSSEIHLSLSRTDLLQGVDSKSCVLAVEVETTDSESVGAYDLFYFEKPKDLSLKDPQLEVRYSDNEDPDSFVVISSQSLVKNVYLELPGIEGAFEDNFFDVLPGREYEIYFTGGKQNLDDLKIRSLVDTY